MSGERPSRWRRAHTIAAWSRAVPWRQLLLYGATGITSAGVDFIAYLLLLRLGIWYIAASLLSFVLSFATAFLLHKYVVFRRPETFSRHLRRHLSVELGNLAATTLILYALVEGGILGEEWAKVATVGAVVCWNFLIFKFLIYV